MCCFILHTLQFSTCRLGGVGGRPQLLFFFLHVWFVGTFCCLFASLWCNYISCVTEKKKV